jgi:hypothetical protein
MRDLAQKGAPENVAGEAPDRNDAYALVVYPSATISRALSLKAGVVSWGGATTPTYIEGVCTGVRPFGRVRGFPAVRGRSTRHNWPKACSGAHS